MARSVVRQQLSYALRSISPPPSYVLGSSEHPRDQAVFVAADEPALYEIGSPKQRNGRESCSVDCSGTSR
jgi:hypothetical protein